MAVSEAQKRATVRFRKKSYDRVEFLVAKGGKEQVKAAAAASGDSLGAYITRAVSAQMERDGLPPLAPLGKPIASSGQAADPGDGDANGDGPSAD